MRKTCFIIWLSLIQAISIYAGEIKDLPKEIGPVKFKYIKNWDSAIDIHGEITNTDDLKSFTINFIPVQIYKKEFRHRVYLKAGKHPLEICINDEFKEFLAIRKDDKNPQSNLVTEIEKDPYNIKLHKRYIEQNKDNIESVKKQYDKWFDNKDLNPRDLPNACIVYFMGYAYELNENWELAKIKYEETIYLDEYFAPAHFGLAKYYLKNKDMNKALEHCNLADLYNYNNVFDIDLINEFYNKIDINDEGFDSVYIYRAFHKNPKILKKRFLDIKNPLDFELVKTYLEILRPKGINVYDDELKNRIKIAKEIRDVDQLSDILKKTNDKDVCKILGDIFSILCEYNRQNSDNEGKPDIYDKLALMSYYKARPLDNIEIETYDDVVIELHKERDHFRGAALINKAKKLNSDKSAPLFRESLLCFTGEEKKKEINGCLDEIYEKQDLRR